MTRFKWPIPSDAYFRRTFVNDELAAAAYRIERCGFIWEEFGPPSDMLLVGGVPSMFALGELKRSFIYGNFIATVLLAQAYLEHSLGGTMSLAGDESGGNMGLARLTVKARVDGLITESLADSIDSLRAMRNPYTHHVDGAGPRTYMGRLAKAKFVAPEDMALEDAKYAIRVVVNYLRHGSPKWHPDYYQWSEDEQDE